MLVWVPLENAHRQLPDASGVYLLRRRADGQEYVGISKNVRRRAMRHRLAKTETSLLHRAIAAHGAEAFEVAVWCLAPVTELAQLEVQAIAARGSFAPAGFNLTRGGGIIHGDQHAHTRRAKVLETNRRLHLGVKRSAETRAKMSRAAVGRIMSPETIEKMSRAARGHRMPAVTRQAINASIQRTVLLWPRESTLAVEFLSVRAVVEHTGKSRSSVQQLLKEGRPAADGLVIAYAD